MDRERPVERFLPLRPVEFDILLSLAALTRAARLGGLLEEGAT